MPRQLKIAESGQRRSDRGTPERAKNPAVKRDFLLQQISSSKQQDEQYDRNRYPYEPQQNRHDRSPFV
ncbi:MAG: hypothetical protein JWR79_1579, partial [Tardiphaga sp.]|nr:hypothetical protein [Tardiphaga sp.]